MNSDVQRLRQWFRRYQLQTPAAILAETYRPLGFFLGQLMHAIDPLLPGVQANKWGDIFSTWESGDSIGHDQPYDSVDSQ